MLLQKQYLSLVALATLLPSHTVASSDHYSQAVIDSGRALAGLNSVALANSFSHLQGGCTPAKLQVRQEWRTLPARQRKSFISAVKCLQTTPSLFPEGEVPGSYSLFEDYAAVHLNQTPYIHLTVRPFLSSYAGLWLIV